MQYLSESQKKRSGQLMKTIPYPGIINTLYLVRLTGLEPAHLSAQAPQACVSTNSTIDAFIVYPHKGAARMLASYFGCSAPRVEPGFFLAYET